VSPFLVTPPAPWQGHGGFLFQPYTLGHSGALRARASKLFDFTTIEEPEPSNARGCELSLALKVTDHLA
jgi:hypothetical protein